MRRSFPWLGAFLLAGSLSAMAGEPTTDTVPDAEVSAPEPRAEPRLGFAADLGEERTRILEMRVKPARFESFSERLDFVHDNLQPSLQRHVEKMDTILDDGTIERVSTPPSRFRLTPYVTMRAESGIQFSIKPDFEAEVELPNLKKRLKIFLDSSLSNELPGLDPPEQKERTQIGLRNEWWRVFRSDIGVRANWPPALFASVEWRPEWSCRNAWLRPRQKLFYDSGDGLGALGSLTVHRWFSRQQDTYWQTVSAAKYATKSTDGIEMEQSILLGWVRQALESNFSWRNALDSGDIARGHTLRYSLFGHINSEVGQLDRHRFTYTYRRPLYKHWMYLEIAPGVEAKAEDDWDVHPSLTIGVDMLFWGTYER